MLQLFCKYLILNKRAHIPGLGIFFIEHTPARLDLANKVFIAPGSQINFKAQTSVADDRLYTFISYQQKIEESEAVIRYNDFADTIKRNLKEHKRMELPGIGVLLQDDEGHLYFKATSELNDYFPPAPANKVLIENTEHPIVVGDIDRTNRQGKGMFIKELNKQSLAKEYWRKFAIALVIIAIAGILFYYLHNGSLQ